MINVSLNSLRFIFSFFSYSVCGGRLVATTGTIFSPNYPNDYDTNKDCVWTIHAPNGKQIELNVKFFELESHSSCTFDYLEIRNGGSDKSPLIGTFCGNDILPRIKSFSNQLYLRFKTDSSNERKGFEIEYDTTTTGCGGAFTNTLRGSITSPNYP